MSAIEEVLWPGMKLLEPSSKLGGVLARKPGYHNSRDHLPTSDYSVSQFAIDRQGPEDEGSAIDWTFPDAQAGNYDTISKYSKRLYAVRNGDSRTVYMREFFGQIDSDRTVEGWDYSKNRASTSDSSHLWHIHISIHRKYIDSAFAMRAILSILKGQSEEDWKAENSRLVTFQYFDANLPILWRNDSDPVGKVDGTAYIIRAQRMLNVADDGDYGPITTAAVKNLGIEGKTGTSIDFDVWHNLYALWGATQNGSHTEEGRVRNPITYHHFTNAKLPTLKFGDSDDAGGVDGSGTAYIKRVQKALKVAVDGDYGVQTANAVKSWMGAGDGKTIDLAVYQRIYAFQDIKIIKTETVNPADRRK